MSRKVGYLIETPQGLFLGKLTTIREALSMANDILTTQWRRNIKSIRVVRVNDGNAIYTVSLNKDKQVNIEKLRRYHHVGHNS